MKYLNDRIIPEMAYHHKLTHLITWSVYGAIFGSIVILNLINSFKFRSLCTSLISVAFIICAFTCYLGKKMMYYCDDHHIPEE